MDTLEIIDVNDSENRMAPYGFSFLQLRRLISAVRGRSILLKKGIRQ
jgi:hypothetical protein